MSERPEFIQEKTVSKGAARKEGKSDRGKYRPTTQEDIDRGLALRAAQAALGPTQQVTSHFIMGVEWLSATIEGDDIVVTGRFDGYIHRPEAPAEVMGTVATVRIPAKITTDDAA